jgi:hypothetical protein
MQSTKSLLKTVREKKLSRRGLLAGAGKFAAGAAGTAIALSGGINLLSQAHAKNIKFPWGYKKISHVRAGNIAYENWYKNFCCYAVASGILIPLQEDIGEPFTLFPLEATVWGHGGAVGWGTLCGALNGAGLATALIAGNQGEEILNDVIAWYVKATLPIYSPSNRKARIKTVSKSNSPLCHISVGKWMKKEKVNFFSPQRRERCARISADVAMKTINLLNDWVDGKYKRSSQFQVKMYQMPTEHKCSKCHGGRIPKIPRI